MRVDSLEVIIEDVRAGKPIVLVDDCDRENEGDLMVAAEKTTAQTINFMMQEGKGLICLTLTEERLRALRIPRQVTDNSSVFGTNFTVSVDHSSVVDRGVTAEGREKTILAAMDEAAGADDFSMPGFVFPIGAVEGGVLKRRGQTEGSVDLARLAGLKAGGVICEIMSEDGGMLRGDELEAYCRRHNLHVTSVEEICQHRLRHEVSIRRVSELPVTVKMGLGRAEKLEELHALYPEAPLRTVVYVDDVDGKEHFAFVKGTPRDGCLVRIHSQCLTGDIFESRRCDCGHQFDRALEAILQAGEGVLVYLHQEGRGIGLGNKLRAYELQEQGLDTVDANILLGFAPDQRDYRVGAQILSDLGLKCVRLITNNPEKLKSLSEFGIKVTQRVAMPVPVDKYNAGYLETKRQRMGHILPPKS
jgi:3,4-dihydroxy 2-butanone 4-phosphate synthase / GTP cyclohydrolase II